MNNKILFALWGGLFALCALLGLLGLSRGVWTVVSVVFFLPPAALAFRAGKRRDNDLRLLIRNLSAASLGLTLIGIVLGIVTASAASWVGNAVHVFLTIVSAPMMLCGYWALSLFLWACLFVATVKKL